MQPYVGEIIMFAGTFAPKNYGFCNGAILAISENDALFSLLGTTYGGNGRSSFGLPDLRGRIPVHQSVGGSPTGGIHSPLGSMQGVEEVTLTEANMPAHTHPMQGSTNDATNTDPQNLILATTAGTKTYGTSTDATKIVEFDGRAVEDAGGDIAHSNMMPTLSINFIIALLGTYPSRN